MSELLLVKKANCGGNWCSQPGGVHEMVNVLDYSVVRTKGHYTKSWGAISYFWLRGYEVFPTERGASLCGAEGSAPECKCEISARGSVLWLNFNAVSFVIVSLSSASPLTGIDVLE
jgi:hypothetical protein